MLIYLFIYSNVKTMLITNIGLITEIIIMIIIEIIVTSKENCFINIIIIILNIHLY